MELSWPLESDRVRSEEQPSNLACFLEKIIDLPEQSFSVSEIVMANTNNAHNGPDISLCININSQLYDAQTIILYMVKPGHGVVSKYVEVNAKVSI